MYMVFIGCICEVLMSGDVDLFVYFDGVYMIFGVLVVYVVV